MSTIYGYDRTSAAVNAARFVVRWHDGSSRPLPYRAAVALAPQVARYGGRGVSVQRWAPRSR